MESGSNSSIEKCCCKKTDTSSDCDSAVPESTSQRDKRCKLSLPSLNFNLRRGKSLQFMSKRSKKTNQAPANSPSTSSGSIKKSPKWGLKFMCAKSKELKVALNRDNQNCCQCFCSKKTEEDKKPIEEKKPILEKKPIEEKSIEEKISVEEQKSVEEKKSIEDINSTDVVEDCKEEKEDPPISAGVCTQNEVHEQDQNDTPNLGCNFNPENVQMLSDSGSDKSCDSPDIDYNVSVYGSNVPGHIIINGPLFDMTWISSMHEDCDETARLARAREIEQGVEAPAHFQRVRRVQLLCSEMDQEGPRRLQLVCPRDLSVDSLRSLFQTHVTVKACPMDTVAGCHTQVDFIHVLVPDLYNITNCSFYWGKMDRYEAERLLDGKPEGTFLLRDSAQEEFLFSVSFRKYGRSLHARIEQWNHKFSFDAHDPGVYTSDTVCGLIEHYKDPSSCMFFEPMLTWPLHRNFTFSLQHLCRAVIVNRLSYDDINQLQLPKSLKNYMKEYHYRQKVRVSRFDDDVQWLEVRNLPP